MKKKLMNFGNCLVGLGFFFEISLWSFYVILVMFYLCSGRCDLLKLRMWCDKVDEFWNCLVGLDLLKFHCDLYVMLVVLLAFGSIIFRILLCDKKKRKVEGVNWTYKSTRIWPRNYEVRVLSLCFVLMV